jgi:hypothetical protein
MKTNFAAYMEGKNGPFEIHAGNYMINLHIKKKLLIMRYVGPLRTGLSL